MCESAESCSISVRTRDLVAWGRCVACEINLWQVPISTRIWVTGTSLDSQGLDVPCLATIRSRKAVNFKPVLINSVSDLLEIRNSRRERNFSILVNMFGCLCQKLGLTFHVELDTRRLPDVLVASLRNNLTSLFDGLCISAD
jgi:hypothetical protein